MSKPGLQNIRKFFEANKTMHLQYKTNCKIEDFIEEKFSFAEELRTQILNNINWNTEKVTINKTKKKIAIV